MMFNKILKITFLKICVLLFFLTEIAAQSHYLLDNFSAFRDGKRIILTWTIGQGNSCIGIGIYRSKDDLEYEKIHEFFGECGSPSKAQFYSFVDENPIQNSDNFYVLELGFSGRTTPVLVTFEALPDSGSKVVPNPVSDSATIIYLNPNEKMNVLKFFNNSGQLITEITSSKSTVTLPIEQFSPGIYFYEISDFNQNRVSSGKFVVVH